MPISMKFISTSSSGKLILLLLIDPRFISSSLSSFPIRALKNRQRTRRDRIIELKVKTDKIKYIFIIEGKKKRNLLATRYSLVINSNSIPSRCIKARKKNPSYPSRKARAIRRFFQRSTRPRDSVVSKRPWKTAADSGKIHVGKWRESIIRAPRTPISHPVHKSLSPLRGNRAGDVLASPVSRPVDINSTDRIRAKVKPWTSKNFPFRFPFVRPLFDPCISSLARKKRNETTDSPFRLVVVFPNRVPFPALLLPLIEQPFQRLAKCTSSPTPLLFSTPFPGLVKLDEKFLPRARTHLPSSHVSFGNRRPFLRLFP